MSDIQLIPFEIPLSDDPFSCVDPVVVITTFVSIPTSPSASPNVMVSTTVVRKTNNNSNNNNRNSHSNNNKNGKTMINSQNAAKLAVHRAKTSAHSSHTL